MKKNQLFLLIGIFVLIGAIAFTIVKFNSQTSKMKAELNSYYSTSSKKSYPQYVVTADGVNLRLDPDVTAKGVAALKAGSVVDVIKKGSVISKVGGNEGYWYNVKYGEKYGWIFEGYLMEKDKVATDIPDSYNSYIAGLSSNEVNSVSKAAAKFKSCAALLADSSTKDDMFRKFMNLYNSILKNNQDTYFTQSESSEMLNFMQNQTGGINEYSKWVATLDSLNSGNGIGDQSLRDKISNLKTNGFRVKTSEGMFFVDEDPTFIASNFSNYVSQEIKDYLSLRSSDLKNEYSEDAGLIITWDQLSDRIASWDSYIKKYPSTPETAQAKNLLKGYVRTYFYGMDNSRVYDLTEYTNSKDELLISELQKSYQRFMQKYPNSSYYPIVRSYYNMVSNNNFKITNQAKAYLKSNGIE